MAQEGFEPSASLVLSESGLPVAYRAVFQFRGLESNQRPPRSERGVATSSNHPAVLYSETRQQQKGSGRRIRTSVAWFKGRQPTVSRSPRVPCGSRTRLSSLEGWRLCRSAKGTFSNQGGRRGSRTLKAHRSPDFESGAVTHRLALPSSRSSCAGSGRWPDLTAQRSTGGRSRTSNCRLNRAPPYR